MRAARHFSSASLALGSISTSALGQRAERLGAPAAPSVAVASVGEQCVEKLPADKPRPKLKETLPSRGLSGHALTLTLEIEHGKGETVLPSGLSPQAASKSLEALERGGLYLPDPDGGAGPVVERRESGENATTTVKVSFVPLPEKPGRNQLFIPPLPITVARASGRDGALHRAASGHHRGSDREHAQREAEGKPAAASANRGLDRSQDRHARRRHRARGGRAQRVADRQVAAKAAPRAAAASAAPALGGRARGAPRLAPRRALAKSSASPSTTTASPRHRCAITWARATASTGSRAPRARRSRCCKLSPRIPVLDTIESFLRDADLVKFARFTPSEADCVLSLSR